MATMIKVGDYVVSEADGYVDIVFELSEASGQNVSFNWGLGSGTAVPSGYSEADYYSASGNVVFAAGETSKTVRISLINDGLVEALQNFRIYLSGAQNATLERDFGTVTIVDNDTTAGTPGISVSDAVVDERAGIARFTVTLDKPSTGTVQVNFATADGSAVAGNDYLANAGSLTFEAGQTAKTVTVSLVDDAVTEGHEQFALNLSGASGATLVDAQGVATLGASDAATVSLPVIRVSDLVVGESDGYAELVFTLDAPSSQQVSVNFDLVNGTAVETGYSEPDFADNDGTVVFAAGQTTATVRIDILDDTVLEPRQTIGVVLSGAQNASIEHNVTQVTIVDDDGAAGTPGVSVSDAFVDENAGVVRFTVSLDKPSTGAVSVTYASANGAAIAGSDYTAVSGALGFAAGETVKTVVVAINNDTAAESAEQFQLRLTGATGGTLVDALGVATIGANDSASVSLPVIRVSDLVVGESDGYAELVFTLDAPSSQQVSFNYGLYNSTAVETGYTEPDFIDNDGTVVFAAGQTTATVRIDILDDTALEARQGIGVYLSSAKNATIERSNVEVSIVDDDGAAGTPGVSVSDAFVDENASVVRFTVSLDKPSTGAVSLSYATADSGATAGSDYTATSGTLAFAAGETAKTVVVAINNDTAAESAEQIALKLSGVTGGTLVDTLGIATIGANDGAASDLPVVRVSDLVVGESDGYAELVFTLNAPSTQQVSFNYGLYNGTAVETGYTEPDFVDNDGTIVFAAGQTTATLRIDVLDDTALEARQSIGVYLSSPTNAALERSNVQITIVDDDGVAGTPGVSVSDAFVDENAGVVRFTVSLDKPSTSAVSLSYATADAGATAGSDYTAASGTLAFAAGETAKTVVVALKDDTTVESAEQIALKLSGVTGGTLVDTLGIATIGASDSASVSLPVIRMSDIVVGESDGYAEVVFTLDAPSGQQVSFNYGLYNSTAVETGYTEPDFVDNDGSIVFAAGQTTTTLRVDLLDDTVLEARQGIGVYLSGAKNATLERSNVQITIVDDDGVAGTPGVSVSDAFVDENAGVVRFTVSLDKPSSSAVSLSYATADAGATAGSDYTAASGTLAFAAGETAKTVVVAINNDTTLESAEQIALTLSAVTGGTLVDAQGIATIGASDSASVSLPVIRVSDLVAGESDGYAELVFTLNAPSGQQVSFNYDLYNGTAVETGYTEPDFVDNDGTIVFAAGQATATLRIDVLDDTALEARQSIGVHLSSPTNAALERSNVQITIVDDDGVAGAPGVSVSDAFVDENAGVVRFTVSLDKPSTSAVSLSYATADAGATAGSDYTAASGTLAFAAGETAKTVVVALKDDTTVESAEQIALKLSGVTGGTLVDTLGIATIGASDTTASDLPVVRVSDLVVGESDGYAELVFTLNAPSTQQVSFNYGLYNGTAVETGYTEPDFVDNDGSIVFAAGQTTATLRVDLLDDLALEARQNIGVHLSDVKNAALERSNAQITIVDDDGVAGTPGVSVSDAFVDENAGVVRFTVSLDKPSTGAVSLSYATADAGATAGSDYTAANGTLAFAAGETAKTVVVAINNDTAAESAEQIALKLSGVTGGTLVDTLGIATIGTSDGSVSSLPVVRVSDLVVGESDGYAELVFTLNAPNTQQVSFNYDLYNGTAVETGYTEPDFADNDGTIVFAAGQTTATLRVDLLDDAALEARQSIGVHLSDVKNAALERSNAQITIVDDDGVAGTPGVSVSDAFVDENAGVVRFTVSLDRPSTGAVSLSYATADAGATAGSDYTAANGTLAFAAGETAKTVVVALKDDTTVESAEQIALKLSGVTGGNLVDGTGIATIGTSDGSVSSLPVVRVSDIVVGESDGYAELVFTLDAPGNQPVSFNYDLVNGSAVETGYTEPDFSDNDGSIVFAAGQTTATLRVDLLDDLASEAAQSLCVRLSNVSNAILERTTAQVTIIDDDGAAGTPTFIVGDTVVDEDAGTATVTVWLDRPSTGTVSVNYATANRSAVAGSDYVAQSGTLSFGAGETAKTVTVALINDTAAEDGEFFDVRLSSASGAKIADGGGSVRIGASDRTTASTPVINVADVTVSENAAYVDVTFTLSAPSSQTVSTSWSLGNGTAVASGYTGADFVSNSGVVSFGAGDTTKVVRIDLLQDAVAEGNQWFTMYLSNAVNASLSRTQATITLTDDDNGYRVLSYGSSDDVYTLSAATDVVVENPDGGTDLIVTAFSHTLEANVENGRASGSGAVNLSGNALANLLYAGAGNNVLAGGDGIDTASYADAASAVAVSLAVTTAQATGGSGSDTLAAIENLTGSNYADTLSGNSAANVLNGGAGADRMTGGDGSDIYYVDNTGDVVTESNATASTGGTDTVYSALASYTLTANVEVGRLSTTAAANLKGNAAANSLYGNAAANVLDGGTGADALVGGDGSDTYYVDNTGDVVTESNASASTGGTDIVYSSLAAYTLGANVENGRVNTSGTANLTGNELANVLYAGSGNNVLNGAAGSDTVSYAYASAAVTASLAVTTAQATGGSGSDTLTAVENLTGSGYADTLTGNSAANILNGGAGADRMTGGDGSDSYYVDNTGDVVTESNASASTGGTDIVYSSLAAYTLGANVENGRVDTSAAANLTGNDLANVLYAGSGDNVLNGAAGSDTVSYAYASAAVTASLAVTTAQATGGSGSDTLSAVENLTGSNYADTLTGNGSANVLRGGAGADRVTGGGGSDQFVLDSLTGSDTITDFVSGTDKVKVVMSSVAVGDGDATVEGAATVAGPGGFASTSELVVLTGNISGSITTTTAAAKIGNASSAYAVGAKALFVVDNGSSSALYLFKAADADAAVEANELTLLATLDTASTVAGDYLFGG